MGNRVGDAPVQSRGPALDAVNIDRVQALTAMFSSDDAETTILQMI